MRQLFPEFRADADPASVYTDPRRLEARDRPYVFVNMVASADGGTVVNGVTEQLGSDGDRHIFLLLRSMADGILVGAETVRNEGYGPPRIRTEFRAGREARGQSALPRLAVVTRSLRLDWASPLFTDGTSRPFVLAPEDADSARLEEARGYADVITAGAPLLDFDAALRQLGKKGIAALLCEGGPTLNAALIEAGLIDELCLTISPLLVGGGGGSRIMGAAALPQPAGLSLASVLEEDGYLFLRYLATGAVA